ncbi:MAG: DnaJ domain-containing protein [Hyphomicrobiaceae bacterium]|nr:MAG: DnaJ domain-containing protein [Hyphomicrobiaceae bacterium]
MMVWQKISGLATAVGDMGGSFLGELAGAFGMGADVAPEQNVAFTIGVIALSAKMAKADGIVSPLEVDAFERAFHFSPEEEVNVERVFGLAKQDVAGYEAYADQVAALLKDNRRLLQHVLEGLLHVAAADGVLHPKEDAYLHDVAGRFGFSDVEFRQFRARFVVDPSSPYEILRISPDATDEEVKAQYRKLVANNHPDKLMGSGVPPEFIDIATRKLAAINAAYDAISKERGL